MSMPVPTNAIYDVVEEIANPFKGPKSYEEQDAIAFYGRDDEISGLFQLIRLNALTILYSQSGVGKSSLLRAGLMPAMRHNDYLPIYIRPNYGNSTTSFFEFIVNQVSVSIDKMVGASSTVEYGYGYSKPYEDETLFEYFNRTPFYKYVPDLEDENKAVKQHLMPVLIFDQFEEIFTIGYENEAFYNFLRDELSFLIENNVPPNVIDKLSNQPDSIVANETKLQEYANQIQHFRIVFSLREEYLSNLDTISKYIPSVFYTTSRFRLLPFERETARDVILKISDFVFDTSNSERVIELISGNKEDGKKRKKGEVEPFLLSLVCYHLYPKLMQRDAETIRSITEIDYSIVDRILNEYYTESLRDMPNEVRIFIEEELLTDKGNRTLHNTEDAEKKIGKEYIDRLVDEFRLLRKEEFLDSQHLEIIHDRVTPIIIRSRDKRREEEKAVDLQKELNKQLEEKEIAYAKMQLEAEQLRAEEFQKKVQELENKLAKGYDQKIAEATEAALKQRYVEFQMEKEHLTEERERSVAQTRNDYEKRIERMEYERDKAIAKEVDAISYKYEGDLRRLNGENERLVHEFKELKEHAETDRLDKSHLEKELITVRSVNQTRKLVMYGYAGLAFVFAGLLYLTFINYQKAGQDKAFLSSKLDSIQMKMVLDKTRINSPDSLEAIRVRYENLKSAFETKSTELARLIDNARINSPDSLMAMRVRYENLKSAFDATNAELIKIQQEPEDIRYKGLIRAIDSLGWQIESYQDILAANPIATVMNQIKRDSSRIASVLYSMSRRFPAHFQVPLNAAEDKLTPSNIESLVDNIRELMNIQVSNDITSSLANARKCEILYKSIFSQINILRYKYPNSN